ncbi:hypothetical protein [Halorarum salinum]|uniref:Uncharacterized protein n=1 Tax=Halorarum salinum TaxID=2743089 RepID=A0A7D5LAT9_9EURY|nr:hypothetical protein [Halobaculum salinum]QLG62054.1 hypothetical protein HUG12_10075 [Halobaculum salinum]
MTHWEDGEYADPDADVVDNTDSEQYRKYPSVHPKYYLAKDSWDKDLRTDPDVIEVVERLEDDANADLADLKIVEVPEGVEWKIDEYDGAEHIAEKHRTWS